MRRVLVVVVLLATLFSPSLSTPVGAAGPILTFSQGSIDAQARRLRDVHPSPEVCGGGQFPLDQNTRYEWFPVVPGTAVDGRPTVSPPHFLAGGTMREFSLSDADIVFSHPFGFDYNFLIAPDAAASALVYDQPGTGSLLRVEIEQNLLPIDDLGWGPPRNLDSVLVQGDWIMDCGHPDDYHTEIHPPDFVALARATDPNTTISVAVVNPFRPTQLFNPDENLANRFDDYKRFAASESKPFPDHLHDEIEKVVEVRSLNLEAHMLVEPAAFDVLNWLVCAPSPRPVGATLDFSYHFTARSGVAVDPVPLEEQGCVAILAVQGPDYRPATVRRSTVVWPWRAINKAAEEQGVPVDVKAMIYAILRKMGDPLTYIGIDADPKTDGYPALHTLPGAQQDTGNDVIQGADDQPFPFYGRVRVSWKLPRAGTCASCFPQSPPSARIRRSIVPPLVRCFPGPGDPTVGVRDTNC